MADSALSGEVLRIFEKTLDGRAFDDDNYNSFVGNKIVANVFVETGN
jgi:hypothetical protein